MLSKINNLKPWQYFLIISAVGLLTYGFSLPNGFLGDDTSQIVGNPVIQSITNIRLFFEGGTFYVGNGIAPLYGAYYRPLMTTAFAIVATLFGENPFYFHLAQLLIAIGSAVILFQIFSFTFKPWLALTLSLVFLVHPLNSQSVFALASMQEALMLFFGLLSVWILIRFNSYRALIFAALSLLLALFAKETAVLFVIVSALYLFWWDRERLPRFILYTIPVLLFWLILRVQAVGFFNANPNNAPITDLSFLERLTTIPSVVLFYFGRFIMPSKLSMAYYWTNPSFSISEVLIPLIIDLILLGLGVFGATQLYKNAPKILFYTYLFYFIWALLGFGLVSQVYALDMTASEPWFYFISVGILGMLGVLVTAFGHNLRLRPQTVLIICSVLLLGLAARTVIRGTNWQNAQKLFSHDIQVSSNPQDNFGYANLLAQYALSDGDNQGALTYAQQSVKAYETKNNTYTLGQAAFALKDYKLAQESFIRSLKHGSSPVVYENIASTMLFYGDPEENEKFMQSSTTAYPNSPRLWLMRAIYEYQHGKKADSKNSINKAFELSQDAQITQVHRIITNNEPLNLN